MTINYDYDEAGVFYEIVIEIFETTTINESKFENVTSKDIEQNYTRCWTGLHLTIAYAQNN